MYTDDLSQTSQKTLEVREDRLFVLSDADYILRLALTMLSTDVVHKCRLMHCGT